ncbi:Tex family protein [soil metagenome]
MNDTKQLSPATLLHLAQTLGITLSSLVTTIGLLDEGGTVPFIARYRKEATGALDEVQIRDIEEKLAYFRELASRRETILKSVEEQGKLTDELRAKIEGTLDRGELEDLYLPYRPKRRTKATIAREKGLEPLADYLWGQQAGAQTLLELAGTFIDEGKGVASIAEALEGARHIVAERISEHAELRKALRQLLHDEGVIASKKTMDAVDAQEKFKMYYDYREPVKTIPSHRMLAIRRGEAEAVLYFLIELEPARATGIIRRHILAAEGDWTPQVDLAIEDSWSRLLSSSVQGEMRLELKKRSDIDAIQVFRDNLANLLLGAPAGPISVLGLDPGLRTGCKVAVVDETGKFLAHDVIYPHTGQTVKAAQTLAQLVKQHHVRAIAIGNGTASRETDSFVRDFLAEHHLTDIFKVMVSESGASVYSASDVARQEFPDLDLTVRGAISIARRLQDPLSELVKVDPKSIGVGQYQHDVDQRQLQQSLEATIESCVNKVGVDLNTSSWTLLRYVAGVTERTALNIVQYRDENGRFTSREQLKKVSGVGAKTFEQAAGFLRIRGGTQPLDSTAVHPESYAVVEQIAAAIQAPIDQIIANPSLLDGVDKGKFSAGSFTLNDIFEELRKPGRDPRDKFVAPAFHEGVRELSDVQPDMVLEGVVTNVTKFGAFVDIGVHQDGLVHISELSNRYIKDPNEAVKAGQIVKVKVISADLLTKRIALSMKALMVPSGAPAQVAARLQPPPRPAPGKPFAGKPAARPQKAVPVTAPATMEDKLAALSNRWKVR